VTSRTPKPACGTFRLCASDTIDSEWKGLDRKVKPRVLVVSTCNWISPARLAIALTEAGFTVEGICPSGHLLRKVDGVKKLYTYSALLPLRSVSRAIEAAHADLVLPCDDLATRHLHALYKKDSQSGKNEVAALIEQSLGAPEYFGIVDARTAFMQLAHGEGVRVPKTAVVNELAELGKWAQNGDLPLVLKADGTSSGEGVAVINAVEQGDRAFRILHAPPKFLRTLKWALVNHNFRPVLPMLLRRRAVVNVQSFVNGREATSLIACWKGKVLAQLHFEVLCLQQTAGPASVLRLINNAEMSAAAEAMACKLQLSGLHGFDFMLEQGTGKAYLIEINPRTTQVGHLALGPGRDLPAALYGAVTGQPIEPRPRVSDNDIIVLFPQAWLTNPTNAFLRSGYHDVPWGQPDLMRSCLNSRNRISDWLSRQKVLRTLWGPGLPRL